ncbi:TRAP transporter small permease [Rhizobium sp. L1K21]|uniref:TRAP transporter small permease n=1 Tax=Rhizobium sp. L1K21 TaxID=2954933 RepID=UPI002093235D|nr:TRAP transporter small permease [Rhizobium sp. L1K21]MCO6187244.1 TRAP transporter small permease [Rhizobium sp. L1K21]
MYAFLARWADRLINLSAVIGSAGLIFEVAVILVDVTGRLFNTPLYGAQDLSEMTMSIVVFGGMAMADKLRAHVAVDIFEEQFPAWLNRSSDVFSALAGAAIFAGIAWTVYQSSQISLMLNLATNVIGLPKAWFQWALCAFSVITSFAMLLRAFEMLARKREQHA